MPGLPRRVDPRGHCAGPAWPWMHDSTVRERILKLRPKNVAATDTQMGHLQPPRRPRTCYVYLPPLQHTHTHTHTHTLAHVCTHTPMHTHTHAHRHTCTHMHTNPITHTFMHTRTPHTLLLSPCPSFVLSPHDIHSALQGQDPLCNHRDVDVVVVLPPFTGWSSHDQALSHQLSLALLMEGKGICAFEMQSGLSLVVQAHPRSYKVVNLLVPEPVYVSNQFPLEHPEPLALLSP